MSDGFTFDGKHTSAAALGITYVYKKERHILPASTARTVSIPGMRGVHYMGSDRDPLMFSIDFSVEGSSITDIRRKAEAIAAWLDVDEPKLLVFDDDPNRQYYAIPTNRVTAEQIERFQLAQVAFLVPDAYRWATATKTSGDNEGTKPTPCTITCTIAAQTESLKVTLQETGQFVLLQRDAVRWNVTLQAGDEVVIDTAKQLTTVNGVDARAGVAALSNYFELPVGEYTLVPDPAATTVAVEFRERWA